MRIRFYALLSSCLINTFAFLNFSYLKELQGNAYRYLTELTFRPLVNAGLMTTIFRFQKKNSTVHGEVEDFKTRQQNLINVSFEGLGLWFQ